MTIFTRIDKGVPNNGCLFRIKSRKLTKNLILITGATSGFGKACAELFAQKGYDLIITGRRSERLKELTEYLTSSYGTEIKSLSFDVRDYESVAQSLHSLPDDWKQRIDILVNNAGLATGRGPIHEGLVEDWNQMIDTNIKGLLYVTRIISPWMAERGKGHIINISSIAGKEAYPGGNVYCATKFAVDALSRSMRIDLIETGIKVTNIAPGAAETEFSLVRYKGNENEAKKVYDGITPLLAADIAETVYFVSTRPAHVNIGDIIITPSSQANATVFYRK
jgi:3-hydroxy acid dehydrogenase/malonic semialdehyde reductase